MVSRTSFWAAIGLLFFGSVSCFGYAGVQAFNDAPTAASPVAGDFSGTTFAQKLRSPIHFERNRAPDSLTASTK
jgi:hypothetical protein